MWYSPKCFFLLFKESRETAIADDQLSNIKLSVKVLQTTSVRNPLSGVRDMKPFCKVSDWNLLVTNLTNETFVLVASSDVRGMDPIMELKHRAMPLAIHIGGEWMKEHLIMEFNLMEFNNGT